jgi:hypothetical protein
VGGYVQMHTRIRNANAGDNKVTLHMTTVVGNHLVVFEHMLRHYKDSGIDSLLVNIHLDKHEDELYRNVRRIALRYHADIVAVFVGKWLQSVNPYLYQHTLSQAPNDWFLLADTDELQVYSSTVHAVIETAHNKGYDYIDGFFIDRLSADGRFPSVSRNTNLWNRFPLAGAVTFPLLRANVMKVVAAKGWVKISGGQHHAYNGRGCPRSLHLIPVHHFKWTSGILERLKTRVTFYKGMRDPLWHESQRVLSHCLRHGGKINVADPSFMLKESSRICPHEAELKAFLLANEMRMPRP